MQDIKDEALELVDHKEQIKNGGLLRSKVFYQIQSDILMGKYKNGESLGEKKLSEDFGVSRTPIREALARLELEGLVQYTPNKGAIVVGISREDIRDIYTIRLALEGMAAKLAAEKITDAERKELEEIADLEEFYYEKDDSSKMLAYDSRFHAVIFQASKSRPLIYMLSSFHLYILKARQSSLSVPGRKKNFIGEHRAILEAIKKGDPQLAYELMTKHIANSCENWEKIWQDQQEQLKDQSK